jgi:hypothetical protein
MTRQPRALHYVKRITVETAKHEVCDNTYTYDYSEAARTAHDLAYSHTINLAGSYTSPRDGVFLVFPTYNGTFPHTRYEVVSEDDGIDLYI